MADDTNDLFIFGDDFEAILEILESDGGLEEQFMSAAQNLQNKLQLHSQSRYSGRHLGFCVHGHYHVTTRKS